ncbi:riboflavin biosynthesis pyrimidine reductase [Tamaricihabitans halophyticus]|uniref:Riboflavin biosynthesis pyrimidine reductase n=1 Tax=Tamaricihabitans halophyticus TaxID=1262583 RepID=A0A4R2R3L5_9PSEU|nr:dihydrofolate reductase family protein [Tamaricihabitans halophyticus]TCP56454.1 riboflavin biosynthesis pyrimidine reductase [Tamaricihabitans halophyticus]
MRQIWPAERAGDVSESDLLRLYGFPADAHRWLAVNFVSSADGAVEVAGRSRALTNSADRKVYPLGAALADVLLVGAATAVAERFGEAAHADWQLAVRRAQGLAEVAPIAVVTTGASLPPDAPVLTKVSTPTIVLTCAAASAERRAAWQATGARVLVHGTTSVDLPSALNELAELGLRRIHCDGGPRLFGAALAAGVVDELRLTIAPLLLAGAAGRIAAGYDLDPRRLRLASALTEDDTLLLRYLLD